MLHFQWNKFTLWWNKHPTLLSCVLQGALEYTDWKYCARHTFLCEGKLCNGHGESQSTASINRKGTVEINRLWKCGGAIGRCITNVSCCKIVSSVLNDVHNRIVNFFDKLEQLNSWDFTLYIRPMLMYVDANYCQNTYKRLHLVLTHLINANLVIWLIQLQAPRSACVHRL